MDLLGCIIEKVSGMTFGNFMQENIFDPLGMKDTSFAVPESEINRFTSMYTQRVPVLEIFKENSTMKFFLTI